MTGKIKVFVAVVAIFALVITGTLALQQSIKYKNELYGEKGDPNITLHDDFDPETGKKDVFVENTGDVSFYVRIKLDEVMSLVSSSAIAENESGWKAHTLGDSAIDCGHDNIAGKFFHEYFAWTMGGSKFYMPADLAVNAVRPFGSEGSVIQDITDYNGDEPGVKETPDAQIITVEDFLAMGATEQKSFQGWIYDTDGYAYWSQVLRPGEVTGLLLHGVQKDSKLSDLNYYYAINVIVEAVDIDDIPMWTEGLESEDGSGKTYQEATDAGKEVIYIIVGNAHDRPEIVANEECCDECTEEEDCECGCEECPGASVNLEESDEKCCEECTEEEDCDCGCEDCSGAETGDSEGKGTGVGTGGGGASGGGGGASGGAGEGTGGGSGGAGEETEEPGADAGEDENEGAGEGTGGGSGTGASSNSIGSNSVGGNSAGGGELAVKNPGSTYTPRDGEGAWFTGLDWDLPTSGGTDLDKAGAIRLADILEDANYNGLTVTPLGGSQFDGHFSIGEFNGNTSIIFTYVPDRDEGLALFYEGGDKFPLTTTLLLEQDGKTATITVTLLYDKPFFSFPPS